MTAFLREASVDRGARHVARLRLRAPDRRELPRAQMLVEEVLRLTTLPGEDQGRLYCIRRMRLPTLDERTAPSEWSLQCSRVLIATAHLAARASDPGVSQADAVFFDDVHAPYRVLVGRLLRGESAREWFWPQATGVSVDLPSGARLEQVLERWHAQPAGWAGVARELLPELDPPQARRLLESLASSTVARWLAPWSSGRYHATPPSATTARLPLRGQTERLVNEVRRRFDATDARVLFFAALAVLDACPSIAQDAELLRVAAGVLGAPAANASSSERLARRALNRRPDSERSPVDERAMAEETALSTIASREDARAESQADELANVRAKGWRFDDRTDSAGLYFLLHVLRHLGIEDALAAHPDLGLTHFVARVLLRVAATTGIDEADPILRPLREDTGNARGQRVDVPIVTPRTLDALRRLHPAPDLSERLWAYATRRWCRQVARLGAGDMLKRPGRVHATPTSIDVTLPMSAVDVRIRRAGLDLDPGYLPWFGRVVHFHYHVEGVA